LYQILDKFSKQIFSLFRIDIFKYPTLSSLAFTIYRSKFLKPDEIPLIHGEIFNFIKESYTGGSVDVYKPRPNKNNFSNSPEGGGLQGEKVYRYDVNSLYPYAMKKFPMPAGKPIYFEGDILRLETSNEERPFGIFEVDITAPDNINIPLLQTRIKTDNGLRTIAPIGD
jgi:hypothetical protein